jgi:serine/threonine protein kinase
MVDYAPYPQPLGMDGLQDALPSLQIGDDSSPSKPDDYRIAPIIPQDPDDSSASDVTLTAASVIEVKPALQLVLQDWSGRGAHVDFQPHEQVPLREHRFLGQGSMGPVYETAVRGHVFAWKRRFCRRHIGEAERKELEILKKVSHNHIIQLAGSYTHQQFLGLLLYPVAAYDLATLLEETEMVVNNRADLLASQCEKLGLLCGLGALRPNREGGYMEMVRNEIEDRLIPFVLSKIGCIISAVEYLHSQRIRHKDLKPSNILLSQDGLWLTDFGTATDFSLQTISTTENWERGTPKYFAPEMASYQPSGRAADIFSLGCVVLEMYTAVQPDLPEHLRQLRSAHDSRQISKRSLNGSAPKKVHGTNNFEEGDYMK